MEPPFHVKQHQCVGRIKGVEKVKVQFDIWSPDEIKKAVEKVNRALVSIVELNIKKEKDQKNIDDTIKELGFRK